MFFMGIYQYKFTSYISIPSKRTQVTVEYLKRFLLVLSSPLTAFQIIRNRSFDRIHNGDQDFGGRNLGSDASGTNPTRPDQGDIDT